MLTGTVWGITLLIVGFLLSLGAFQLLMAAAAPGLVAQAARNLNRGIGWQFAAFAAGAAGILLAIGLLAAFSNGGPIVKIITFLPFMVLTLAQAAGLAATSLCVGARLGSTADAGHPWKRVVRGAATLGLAWVVPFVGWFFLLPGTFVVAIGAAIIAIFQRAGRREAAADLLPAPAA